MKDSEFEEFEAELRKLHPAQLPESVSSRLAEIGARPQIKGPRTTRERSSGARARIPQWLWWLTPATAAAIVGLFAWNHSKGPPGISNSLATPAPSTARLRADDIRVDQELVSSFDAIAELPDGEPVRFRFQEWLDQVVVRDSRNGVVIRQQRPRVEVIPVRFETY